MSELNVGLPLKRFYGCYLLRTSAKDRASRGRTYVGFTVDPGRRVRQHNGEIAGGAWKTSRHRPWAMLLFVSGFTSHRQALQFEWAWQNPLRTTALAGVTRKKSWFAGAKGKIRALAMLLNVDSPSWGSLNLTVTVLDRSVLPELSKALPEHIQVVPSTWEELNLKSLEVEVAVEPTMLTCRMCDEPDTEDGEFSFLCCLNCDVPIHRDCIRDAYRKAPKLDLACPACTETLPMASLTPQQPNHPSVDQQADSKESSELDLCSDSEDEISIDLTSPTPADHSGLLTPTEQIKKVASPGCVGNITTQDLLTSQSTDRRTLDLTASSPRFNCSARVIRSPNQTQQSSQGCNANVIDLTATDSPQPEHRRSFLKHDEYRTNKLSFTESLKRAGSQNVPKFLFLQTPPRYLPPDPTLSSLRKVKPKRVTPSEARNVDKVI